jgi:hypothetical protein
VERSHLTLLSLALCGGHIGLAGVFRVGDLSTDGETVRGVVAVTQRFQGWQSPVAKGRGAFSPALRLITANYSSLDTGGKRAGKWAGARRAGARRQEVGSNHHCRRSPLSETWSSCRSCRS